MKSEQLFELLGEMDEKYVEAAWKGKRRNPTHWIRWGAVAACLCLVCAGVFYRPDGETIGAPVPNPDGNIVREESPETVPPVHIVPYKEALTEPEEYTAEKGWMSAEEIGKLERDDGVQMGLCVPGFVTYAGGFYAGAEAEEGTLFAPAGDEVVFNSEYHRRVYSVMDRPDCIALYINGMEVYEKAFEVKFEIDGVIYAIARSPDMDADYSRGALVKTGDGFTVYTAVNRQDGAGEERAYLVNIQPLLGEHWPELFGDDQNYKEAWQIALPLGGDAVELPAQENPIAAGTVDPYEAVWGGCYTDSTGMMYVLLTQDTGENRELVFARNPGLNAENTVFLPADYTQAYLDQLLAELSQDMAAGEVPYVTTAARLDDRNCIEVTMTREDKTCVEKIRAMDPTGGAFRFVFSGEYATHEM